MNGVLHFESAKPSTRSSLNLLSGLTLLFATATACNEDVNAPETIPGNDGGGAPVRDEGSQEESDACTPKTCGDVGCGSMDDGCGGTVLCGEPCAVESDAGDDSCKPLTCESEGKDCGTIQDGCGGEISCGDCGQGACGIVVPNVCGCTADPFAGDPRYGRHARSAGFSGSVEQYDELYDVPCDTAADCEAPCMERGGRAEMCDASECLEGFDGAKQCLPAPVWRNVESIQFEGQVASDGVELVVVFQPYVDTLVVDQFALEIPESAIVHGIEVEIRRAGDETVADHSVRIVKGGETGMAERARPEVWGSELEWVKYGGPEDGWGEEWTPSDLNADDFGVAIAAAYTRTVGNSRAYVDQVRVTVHYADTACD